MSGPVSSPVGADPTPGDPARPAPAHPDPGVAATTDDEPGAVKLVALWDTPLSVDTVLDAVRGPAVGGIGLFVGVVRDHDGGRDVTALHYTAHPSAATVLTTCAAEVAARYAVPAVAVIHRTGSLAVGDLAVVVAAGAAHRGPALAACQALIDDLKATVPIWKEQRFADGDLEWVGLP
jgi:molybdopterin synthase catalytic subunit